MAPSASRGSASGQSGSATHLSNLVDAHPLSSSAPAQALPVALICACSRDRNRACAGERSERWDETRAHE